MTIKYEYYITYDFDDRNDYSVKSYCIYKTPKKINCGAHLEEVIAKLKKEANASWLRITNWKLLRKIEDDNG